MDMSQQYLELTPCPNAIAYHRNRLLASCSLQFLQTNQRVGLAQLVKFLVVKLTHPCSNVRFDMCVVFTANYSFSGRRRPRRQRCALDDRLCESQNQADSVFRICS
jgi:hypothetical protein